MPPCPSSLKNNFNPGITCNTFFLTRLMVCNTVGTMHGSLVSLGTRWLRRRCSIVFYEFATMANENPDVIGWRSGFSILIECKATRADFLRDGKKMSRRHPQLGMGQHRYYLCPPGVIGVEDLPENWGLLWAVNGRVQMRRIAVAQVDRDQLSEIKFLVSMLRRAQVRLGKRPLSEWLRWENRKETQSHDQQS